MSLHSLDSLTKSSLIGSALQAGSEFVFVITSFPRNMQSMWHRRLNWSDEPCPPQDKAVIDVPPKISELSVSLDFSDLSGACKPLHS